MAKNKAEAEAEIEVGIDERVQEILNRLFEPMVLWCVRSGIGYAGVVEFLREVFMLVAHQELGHKNMAITDDALSLASGVHKSAVRDFKKRLSKNDMSAPKIAPAINKVSFSDRVMARWLALEWPSNLPLKKGEKSFKNLCEASADRGKGRSYAFIPPVSLILEDMERRGLIRVSDGQVERLRDVPRASIHDLEVSAYVADAVSDYLHACLDNIESPEDTPVYLEQSIVVDDLPKAAFAELDAVVRQHWKKMAQILIVEATKLCEKADSYSDGSDGGDETTRVRIGFYSCERRG